MTPKTIVIISYLSGIIPLITAIVVFKKASKKFYPFLYFIFLTVFVVLVYAGLMTFSIYKVYKFFTLPVSIAYAFAEMIFIVWIFKNQGILEENEKFFKPFLLFCMILGLIDLLYNGIAHPMKYSETFIRIMATIF